jgi:plastocyanin
MGRFAPIVAIFVAFCPATPALDLTGKIILDRNMVKTPLAPAMYDLRSPVADKPVHIGNRGAFGRVAVWLEGENTNDCRPVTASMNQIGRHFEPDLLIVPVGSKVSFPNLDPIFHNIFSLSHTRDFDLGYYSQGKSREVTFSKEGIVQVYCHIHSEMYGVIVVTSSKWTAHPDRDGSFSWSDVPSGKYHLMIWQRSAGLQHRTIEIPQSGKFQVEVKLPEEDTAGR